MPFLGGKMSFEEDDSAHIYAQPTDLVGQYMNGLRHQTMGYMFKVSK